MRAKDLIRVGLFGALLAVFAQLTVPFPGVPLTLQTFGVALAGVCLGARFGSLAVAVYLLLGGCGLPIFSAFSGGFSVLMGPTGGFLWGFLPLAFCCGLPWKGVKKAAAIALGILICHGLGILQFSLVTDSPVVSAVFAVSLPYLLKDVLSVAMAEWVSKKLQKN